MPNVTEKTSASILMSVLAEYGVLATATNKNGEALADNANVGTGCKVTDDKGNTYTIIVSGDTDGNGSVDSTDYLMIKKVFLNTYSLDELSYEVADVHKNGRIESSDSLSIKRHFLKTHNLYA
jgi:hypothetical protein